MSMSRTEAHRSVTTVMFTDVVGSTQQAAALGDHAWALLLRRHNEVIRREIARFHGREVNTAGDAFLATFPGPESAIRAAFAAREGLRPLGVRIRVGIHAGEVEVEDDSVGGIAVHIAARVMAAAGADEVLVSSTVRDLATGGGFGFEDRGVHPLRGVPGEWRLFAVTSAPVRLPVPGWTARLRERWSARLPGPAIAAGIFGAALLFGLTGLFIVVKDQGRTFSPPPVAASSPGVGIAVLPFAADAEDAQVAREGLMDLLATNLDGVGGFRAIDSRTTLARWRERVGDRPSAALGAMLDVADRTGARYALVGQSVSLGRDVRLSAEIYDVPSGGRLGRASVDGSSSELIPLVDRLTVQVLRILLGDDQDPPRVSLAAVTTDTLEALTAFLEGEAGLRRSEFEDAIAAYRRAVTADSSFALAWYRLGTASAWVEDAQGAASYLERAARMAERLPRREALFLRADLALERGTLDGIPLLREAVKRYPDTPAAWSLLGETYFHLGAQALVPPEASEDALLRAIRLDPRFAPFHLHLVEMAFGADDSARASERVRTFGRLAPGSADDLDNRLAFSLAFGDSAARPAATAAVDTIPSSRLLFLARSYLRHPRMLPLAEQLLASGAARDPNPQVQAYLASVRLERGRVRQALGAGEGDVSPGFRAASVYTLWQAGLWSDERVLERELRLRGSGAEEEIAIFYAGAYAADRERWPDHATAVSAIRRDAETALSAGDSTAWRFGDAAANALEGYGAWRRGDAEAAIGRLEAAQRRATGFGDERGLVNATIRIWLGGLCQQTGDLRKAVRYLGSRSAEHYQPAPPFETIALPRLGALYEELGEPENARRSYATFARVWAAADPEVQPAVREALRSASRLADRGTEET
jgi:class 3 adenylate cyclase/tetratricopeptide (TPR) repeat protein